MTAGNSRHEDDGTGTMRNEASHALRRSSFLLALALAGATVGAAGATAPAASSSEVSSTTVLVTSVAGAAAAAAPAVRAAGGHVLKTLSLIGGVSAQLPAGTVLAPEYRVVPDAPLSVTGNDGKNTE